MPPLAIGIFGSGNATRSTVRGCSSALVLSSLTFQSGEAFRFKPDGVLFNSPSAYRAIYQTKANTKKGKFYEIWPRNSQYINTLTTIDKIAHARKRRVLNSAFSEKAIRSAETFVVKHVDRWTELIINENDGKE
jgi:cytochrome P450